MRTELKETSFKDIVTSLAERKRSIQISYHLIQSLHYARYGEKPERSNLTYQLNELFKMVYYAAYPRNAYHRREFPAQFMLDNIRVNFRS